MNFAHERAPSELPPGTVPYTLRSVNEAYERKVPFMIIQVGLEKTEGGYRVHVDESGKVALATDKKGRQSLENEPNPELYRFAAGGGFEFIEFDNGEIVCPIRFRDELAPSYKLTWTLPSGLSSFPEGITNPTKTAVKEIAEEAHFDNGTSIVIPRLHNEDYDRIIAESVSGSATANKEFLDGNGVASLVQAPARFIDVSGQETLDVVTGDGQHTSHHTGLVVIDEKTRGIDLLKVVHVRVKGNLKDARFYDGEKGGGNKTLNGPVGLLKVIKTKTTEGSERFIVAPEIVKVFQSGRAVYEGAVRVEKATPPLEAMLKAFSNYQDF